MVTPNTVSAAPVDTAAVDTAAVDTAPVDTGPTPRPPGTDNEPGSDRLSEVNVGELMTRNLLTVAPEMLIRDAAQMMFNQRISCLPVVSDQRLVGLITEADFVGRVVAAGHSPELPVAEVMTQEPYRVSPEDSVLEVLTLMTRHRVAHMPVCKKDTQELMGIITQTDVIRHQIASSVFMVGDIARMDNSAAVAGVVQQLPRLLCSLVDGGHSAYETGRVISSITGAVTRRLIELAEQQLGEPPVPFVWLACGSQGRKEQTGHTDQDNCILLDDDYNEQQHGEYFAALARFVCDGLNEAGYVYCPGDMMAVNPRWCQPVQVWRGYFQEWIHRPGQEAQMLASVMFDLRPIYGRFSLFDALREESLRMASTNSIFVAHMTTNSLTHRPPIGAFGRLRTNKEGPGKGMIDLKHDATVPIVDLARLHALSGALTEVNTIERLKARSKTSVLSPSGADDLCQAYEMLSSIRLKHQVDQIKRGESPDNYINPSLLTPQELGRVRKAFKKIKGIQSAMEGRVAVVGR